MTRILKQKGIFHNLPEAIPKKTGTYTSGSNCIFSDINSPPIYSPGSVCLEPVTYHPIFDNFYHQFLSLSAPIQSNKYYIFFRFIGYCHITFLLRYPDIIFLHCLSGNLQPPENTRLSDLRFRIYYNIKSACYCLFF